jgi:hypothetical protein
MLQLNNPTHLKCSLGIFPNPEGIECIYAVAKATFAVVHGRVVPAEEQVQITIVDESWGDPLNSSLKSASEMTLVKPSTDIILIGHAYAPKGRARETAVRLRVGELDKTIWVFGDRVWLPGVLGHTVSDPRPFDRIPLRYEFAFGGTDPDPYDTEQPDYEPRNPIGRGLVPRRSRLPTDGIPLPNLEDPDHLIQTPGDRPVPACFAPVCAHWEPRRSFAGTYDDTWQKKRAPYLSADFDPRFFQSAHPDLITREYLKGGEQVEIVGASPIGTLKFLLPTCRPRMIFHWDGREIEQGPNLDTVIFEPDDARFSIVWRACLVTDKKTLRLSELEIICPEFGQSEAA